MAQTQPPRRRGRARIETPNPIDVLVGTRLRLRRNMLGLSQQRLGEAVGLTFQQVQKYERGANRIGASRLHELSQVLNIPVSFFFDDTDPVCQRQREDASASRSNNASRGIQSGPRRTPRFDLVDQPAFLP